jgi:hypothetical protein
MKVNKTRVYIKKPLKNSLNYINWKQKKRPVSNLLSPKEFHGFTVK